MIADVMSFRLDKTLEEFLEDVAVELAKALREEGNGTLEIWFTQGNQSINIQKEVKGDRKVPE